MPRFTKAEIDEVACRVVDMGSHASVAGDADQLIAMLDQAASTEETIQRVKALANESNNLELIVPALRRLLGDNL